jgi:2',3'-cyclic-nucleotide 2'-phosphodiesterase (5'-nucleotidase family)
MDMTRKLPLGILFVLMSMLTFGQIQFQTSINNSANDVEEAASGAMDITSSDLELVEEASTQTIGLRFTGIKIPQNAVITNAFIQFTVDETNSEATSLVFNAEKIGNAPIFDGSENNITSRVLSDSSVIWENIPAWANVGDATDAQKTPNLAKIVQEVVMMEDWAKGNALTFIISGSGKRVAQSFDNSADAAPKLTIEYYISKTVASRINSSIDDLEEPSVTNENVTAGEAYFDSSDLEMVDDEGYAGLNQTIGLRFTGIEVPANALIHEAKIQFTADESHDAATNLYFKIEDAIMATAFVADAMFQTVSSTIVEDSTLWANIPAWTTGDAGAAQLSPNLAPLVQAVVNKEGWKEGNAMKFFINGTGKRVAESFDGKEEAAPQLQITYLTDKVSPVLVKEIPDQKIEAGWDVNVFLPEFFADEDSELTFSAELSGGRALPEWLKLENGLLHGSHKKAITLKIYVTANGDGEEVSDDFEIVFMPRQKPMLTQLGSIMLGSFDEGAAEISAYDKVSKKLFVTNAERDSIEIVDITDPTNLVHSGGIDISTYGGGVNSVAVGNGLVAAAIEADTKQDPGKVVVFNTAGEFQWEVTVGALPDMVTFNQDATKIIVANEGEPNSDYSVDPEGSVSIIDVATKTVKTADFKAFNGKESELLTKGIRIFGPNASVAQDMEPEYITVKGDSAFVTCQENNAIAVVSISTATVKNIYGLGYKEHSVEGNGLDASNKAKFIDIRPWPIKGIYQPDAIASYVVDGKEYLLTANEGDAREYIYEEGDEEIEAYVEEISINDIKLDATVFPNADFLMDKVNLGKLKFTSALADTNANGEYTALYAFGARSFSIWDAANGEQVYDSGDEFEQVIAALLPENFNCADDDVSAKDRSDNKGPEPEAITIGKIGDKTYAFIGMERVGGIAVYDITDPLNPMFVEYTNNRDFETDPEEDHATHGDVGPEGLIFIDAADSPNGKALVVVSNEVSGTVTVYSAGEAQQPYSLAILHNNDGESDLLGDSIMVNGQKVLGSSVAQFKTVVDNLRDRADELGYASIMLSSGDNFLAGKEFNASKALGTYFDVLALDAIDYDAICLGNHDFDFGPKELASFINAYQVNKAPYLSANLSYENEADLQALVNADRILPYTVVEKKGEKIGVIGLTTPTINVISSPGNVTISEMLADTVNFYVDKLTTEGVNKIILISHLQNIKEDTTLAKSISGVDIMIAGGGDELLANNPELGKPYNQEPWAEYPLEVTDKAGKTVYIVTTPGNYRYVGNLTVDFNNAGEVTKIYPGVDPVLVANVEGDADLITNVIEPIADYIKELSNNVIAESEVDLDFRKSEVRTRETNGGNLVADALLWQAVETNTVFGVAKPDVAIQNGGGLRIEKIIPKGDFTEVLTYDICAFDNILAVLEAVTPEHFLQVMEHALGDVENVGGRFSQIAGFKVEYNPLAPVGERVGMISLADGTKIVENGEIVDGAPSINVATIDYLAGGGDGYPYEDLGYEYKTLGATYQQALTNYLTSESGLDSLITEAMYPVGGSGRIVAKAEAPIVALPFYEDFDADMDGWKTVNALGEQVWSYESKYGIDDTPMLKISGYSGGAQDNEDWLISPALDVKDKAEVKVSFQSNTKYSGPALSVVYSVDYDGFSNPASANWTEVPEITVAQDQDNWVWEKSGNGVIAGLSAEHIHLAFVYYSNATDGAATWEVDSVFVDEYTSTADDFTTAKVSVYPNPTNGNFILDLGGAQAESVEIFNIIGERVYSTTSFNSKQQISLEGKATGIYLVKVSVGAETQVVRIIKQ